MPSANTARSASTAVTDAPSLRTTPFFGERLGRVHVRLVGERGEDDVAVVDERDRRGADVEVVIALRHHLVDQVGERTGRLDAGGSRRRR